MGSGKHSRDSREDSDDDAAENGDRMLKQGTKMGYPSSTRFRRRQVLKAGAFAGIVSVPTFSSSVRAQKGPIWWPQFQRDAGNTGFIDTKTPANQLNERWRASIQSPHQHSSAIVQGTVYSGGFDHLKAFRLGNGAEQWSFETNDDENFAEDVSTPAVIVRGDSVYFSTGGAKVFGLFRRDGSLKWRFDLSDSHRGPVVADADTIFVGDTNRLYALNASDGTPRWTFSVTDNFSHSPALQEDTVVIAGREEVTALKRTDGSKKWAYSEGFGVGFPDAPTIAGDTVYVGNGESHFFALDVETGTKKWDFSGSGVGFFSTAVDADRVYLLENQGVSDMMYALDAVTGTVEWQRDIPNTFSAPAVSRSGIYFGDKGGNLHIVDKSDGTSLLEKNISDAELSSPAITSNLIVIGDEGSFDRPSTIFALS